MKAEEKTTYTNNKKYKLTVAITSSLFTFMFLLFFQPFGVNNYRADEKITFFFSSLLFLFSFVVFITILFLEFYIRPKLITTNLQSKFIIWLIIELILVSSILFMFYNYLGEFHDFNLTSYLKHILEISSILIIPMLGTLFYFKHTHIVKEYEDILSLSTTESSNLEDVVMLQGDYKKDQIAMPLKNMVYIESEDNYASLNYLEDEVLKKYLIRSTLTRLEKKLGSQIMTRINRSTMVNLNHLESFKNISGKLDLKLKNIQKTFTVSKSNQVKILDNIKKIEN